MARRLLHLDARRLEGECHHDRRFTSPTPSAAYRLQTPNFSQDEGHDYSRSRRLRWAWRRSDRILRATACSTTRSFSSKACSKTRFRPLPPVRLLSSASTAISTSSTYVALEGLYPKFSPGGFVIIDDYGGMPPCRQAVEDYRAKAGIDAPIVEIDWTGVFWQKPAGDERRPRLETAETVVAGRLSEAPVPAAKASAPSRSASTNANGKARRKPALSVVVVVYNIPREAPRTLLRSPPPISATSTPMTTR